MICKLIAALLALSLVAQPALAQIAHQSDIDAVRGQLLARTAAAQVRQKSLATAIWARTFKPTQFSNLAGVTFQRIYKITKRTGAVRFAYVNMAPAGSPNEAAAGSYTITAASALFGWTGSGTGVSVPITFGGGGASVTIAAYGTVISDPVTIPWFAAEGDTVAVRSYVTAAGAYVPTESAVGGAYSEGYIASDLVSAGSTANSFAGATTSAGFGPTLVIGNPGVDVAGVYGAGDSIMAGTGWVFQKPGGYYAPGFFADWATESGIPAYNAARSGETLATAVTRAQYGGSIQRQSLAPYFRNAIVEYGTNDFATRSLAQMKADYLAYWAGLAAGGQRVFQTTILPKTTSTDQWQTVANQTPTSDDAVRLPLNQWLRAPASAGAGNAAMFDAGGNLYAILDTALAMEVNADGSAITINRATGAISNGSGGRWYVDSATYDSGTATSWASAQRMNDTSKAWTVNQWWGYTLLITSDASQPTLVGQAQDIASSTATQITGNAFTATPDTGSGYRIYRRPTIDGTHPATWVHQRMRAVLDAAKVAELFAQ